MDVSEGSLIVCKRGRGRPHVEDPLTPVTIWIPREYHERLTKLATLYEVSVSEFGRSAMQRVIDRAID